jgi:maltooligosyltrehalose trehalohydrolase
LLAWYRSLITLRRSRVDLRDGHLDAVEVDHDVDAATLRVRRGGHTVVVNLSDRKHRFDVAGQVLLSWEAGVQAITGAVEVPPRSAVVLGP